MSQISKAVLLSVLSFIAFFAICMVCGAIALLFAGVNFSYAVAGIMVEKSMRSAVVGAVAVLLLASIGARKR